MNKSDEITLTSAPTKTGDTDCCPGNSETTVAADATASISATLQPVVNAHEDSDNDAAAEAAAERGLISFDAQLRPIERFGVNKAESNREESLADELEMADVSWYFIFTVKMAIQRAEFE
ncbi:unnamed protein product [Protopolystoma xenopodis]|uniref:Uncharacterized protein n=1 Tax=Protopolystoma xenopodis TaxID=117903 RepID=A0A448XRW3_9PLAT|nr:unnamed protein product [Protopolystoma xenopodis]